MCWVIDVHIHIFAFDGGERGLFTCFFPAGHDNPAGKNHVNRQRSPPWNATIIATLVWCLRPRSHLRTTFELSATIAILPVTSSIDINVPTRDPLAVETKSSFVLWLANLNNKTNLT